MFWAQIVLIPIVLAAFVAFMIGPLVMRLDRWGLPRVAAVLIVTGIVTGLVGGLGYVVVDQLDDFGEELPQYRDNIREKIRDLRALTRGGTIENAGSVRTNSVYTTSAPRRLHSRRNGMCVTSSIGARSRP